MITRFLLATIICFVFNHAEAQNTYPFRLPDTGQSTSYTATSGEDADFVINPPSYTDNNDGTITDNNTGLMWQKVDGGEMTIENATTYCADLALANYTDWRLPTAIELFSINYYNNINPTLNTAYFTKTLAEYWWSSEVRKDDASSVWVVNAGGGIGAHSKMETVSAGGTRKIHVRAVRNVITNTFPATRFTDNGDGTITDNYTGLMWQKIQPASAMSWEEALLYSKSVSLAGKSDWRLPNIKELQSLNDVKLMKPSFDKTFFPNCISGNYWSSTSMINQVTKAWDINIDYGIVSYNEKTVKENVLLVRGGLDMASVNIEESLIPAGTYEMGDHFGFVDPGHPSDETPVHTVNVDSFYMAKTETTNQQYLEFLNSSLLNGTIEVKSNIVYNTGDTNILCYTNQYASYYSIGYDGKVFSMVDFRASHPMVGVRWCGAAAFCNWLSLQKGLEACYDLKTWDCNFTKNGYRLPTEAEWEWAGRGGNINPYFNYPNGNTIDITSVNLPASDDPYETGAYPNTTPVGFYDGTLKQKTAYNWPGSATTYQTGNGANGYGLYDMQGNVWEFINDWYGQNYYSLSPVDNPKGPATGFIMPDGKPYRGMRGGNWYNGLVTAGVNDGHSRVSNRNPSYYRGPQDPNHPYYHLGFRVVRNIYGTPTGIHGSYDNAPSGIVLHQNFPNPFKTNTTIQFVLPASAMVVLKVYNGFGQLVATVANEKLTAGTHSYQWNAGNYPTGIYSYILQVDNQLLTGKMSLIRQK